MLIGRTTAKKNKSITILKALIRQGETQEAHEDKLISRVESIRLFKKTWSNITRFTEH